MLKFIARFIQESNYPPTIREIGQAADISSTSVVNYNLGRLEEWGYIDRDPTISRGLRLLDKAQEVVGNLLSEVEDLVSIPLLGRIVASEPAPIPSSDFGLMGDDKIELARGLIRDTEGLYALEVEGDSMIDALINDGDIVIMRHQERAENGELVAVWLRDQEETTLKRFYLENGQVRLQPANPYMDPIYVNADQVQIQGKVILVIRRLEPKR
jgi:repressor LexA